MFGSNKSAILLVLQLSLCFLGAVNAAPLAARQTSTSTPQTITTTNTYQTDQGLMTETCTVTLTPLADGSGNMQEAQSCSVALASAGASIGSSASVVSTAAPASSATPTSGTAASTSPAAVSATPSASPSASPTVSDSAASATGTAEADNNGANNAASAPSATVAADAATTSLPPFQIPGRSIQIPPIGLGIFCGITGIGILVWTFVTYERTRYRKTFRKRKLAEEAAPMGYGGMAAGIKA